jgi:2'-5' RNA ligase
MSRFAIELYFDELTRERICSVRSTLDQNGLTKILCPARGFVPHISLAVAKELDPTRIVPLVKAFATETKSIQIVLSHCGVFNNQDSTLWLGPTFSNDLRSVHRKLWESVSQTGVGWWRYYTPENWVPHCGLITNRPFEVVHQARRLCSSVELPIVGKLETVTLVDFSEGAEFCLERLAE